jgi:membrane associated rhomboid family serine protease
MGLSLLMLPFSMPAFVFGIIYLVASSYMARHGNDNIGHSAHFWGGIFGILFTLLIKFELAAAFVFQVREYLNQFI